MGVRDIICKRYPFFCFSLVSVILFLNGCSSFVRPPEGPALAQMPSSSINAYEWSDDLDSEGLGLAVEQSKRYYKRTSSTRVFRYSDLIYSQKEMLASLDLFMDITENYNGRERMRQLKEKFLFFESINSEGEAFFTGYYEPVLDGSPVRTDDFSEPLYETPDDLIEVDLSKFSGEWENEKIVGRLEGRQLVPYDSREEIVYGVSLQKRATPIAYVKEIELFFLQIQGSGLISFPGGSLMRVNYAQKNGHPYRAIGRILADKISPEEISLQSIKKYLYDNPDEVREVLSYNQSYTFFREVEEGPLGNIEVPLTPERSIAMDRRIVPRGGLAYIETELPVFDEGRIVSWKPVKRFVLVQDTGGAITDHGRVDLFFGHDNNAELIAGHLKQRGRVFLIVARKEYINSAAH